MTADALKRANLLTSFIEALSRQLHHTRTDDSIRENFTRKDHVCLSEHCITDLARLARADMQRSLDAAVAELAAL